MRHKIIVRTVIAQRILFREKAVGVRRRPALFIQFRMSSRVLLIALNKQLIVITDAPIMKIHKMCSPHCGGSRICQFAICTKLSAGFWINLLVSVKLTVVGFSLQRPPAFAIRFFSQLGLIDLLNVLFCHIEPGLAWKYIGYAQHQFIIRCVYLNS
jgi:hypothetical protein